MSKRDVFISYSHKDKIIADALCHQLEQDKARCWMAPRDISPGDSWSESIVAAIPECRIFLIVFSIHSNMSKQVLREVELAISSGVMVVPVRIEDIMPTGGMKYYLSTVHWIDAVDKNIEESLQDLSQTVGNLIAGKKIGWESGGGLPEIKKRKMPAWLWGAIGTVALAGIVLFVFRTSIFTADNQSLDISNAGPAEKEVAAAETTPEITAESTPEITAEATPEITAEATPEITATVDPNISLDTPVAIANDDLRNAIVKTLENDGNPVDNALTVGDMQNLDTLVISSSFFMHTWRLEGYFCVQNDQGIDSLEGLQYASNLKTLVVEHQKLKDISSLSQLESLEKVVLCRNNISDINPIMKNIGLSYLDVKENQIEDISALSELYGLNYLCIDDNPISSFNPLQNLYYLEELYIINTGISSLNDLKYLSDITVLHLSGNDISSLISLKDMDKLRELDVSDCALTDIYPLKLLNSVEDLRIGRNYEIEDPTMIAEMENILRVHINTAMINRYKEDVDYLINQGIEIIEY